MRPPFSIYAIFGESYVVVTDMRPLTHLVGVAVGYFSYDAIRYIEVIPDCHHSLENMPDIDLKFYRDNVSHL